MSGHNTSTRKAPDGTRASTQPEESWLEQRHKKEKAVARLRINCETTSQQLQSILEGLTSKKKKNRFEKSLIYPTETS
jgi:hypothetical protein